MFIQTHMSECIEIGGLQDISARMYEYNACNTNVRSMAAFRPFRKMKLEK